MNNLPWHSNEPNARASAVDQSNFVPSSSFCRRACDKLRHLFRFVQINWTAFIFFTEKPIFEEPFIYIGTDVPTVA